MNHNDTRPVQANRPVLRRLHRRHVAGAAACVVQERPCALSPTYVPTPEVLVGLPQAIVKQAGMYELLAAELRIAELEKALAEARDAACTDPLTGALNRRGFDLACARELARAQRDGKQLALALIDLDDFKGLNDTLGHKVGDRVLVRLVELLQRSLRPSDVLCRFGGEEFVLMLPVRSVDEAQTAVARLLREFSGQRIDGVERAVTFSAWVVVQGADEALESAIERADAATYAAKGAGKNCVVAR